MKKLFVILLSSALVYGCGNQNDSTPATKETPEETLTEEVVEESTEAAPVETEEVIEETSELEDFDVSITITGDDQMKFDQSTLTVQAGEKVKLTLNHTGKLPKQAMGHNWVLLKPGVDLAKFATACSMQKANDYIANEDDIIAHTGLVGGGESTSIVFEAPAKGTYQYLCSFPGHYGLMQGEFIVE